VTSDPPSLVKIAPGVAAAHQAPQSERLLLADRPGAVIEEASVRARQEIFVERVDVGGPGSRHRRADARRQHLGPAMDVDDGGERIPAGQALLDHSRRGPIPDAIAGRAQSAGVRQQVMITDDVTLDSGIEKPLVHGSAAGNEADLNSSPTQLEGGIDGHFGLAAVDPSVIAQDHDAKPLAISGASGEWRLASHTAPPPSAAGTRSERARLGHRSIAAATHMMSSRNSAAARIA